MKFALIGSHGVGKTTLAYGLASRLKRRDINLEVVHEVARQCPLPLNDQTTALAQSWILHTQVAAEILAQSRYDMVICDRSVLDNFVYFKLAADPAEGISAFVTEWISTYDLLVYVPIIDPPRADGIRAVGRQFQQTVDRILEQEIEDRNLDIVRLSLHHRDRWLNELEQTAVKLLGDSQLPLF